MWSTGDLTPDFSVATLSAWPLGMSRNGKPTSAAMTYTERGEELHLISLREATKHEVRYYFKAISDEA